MAFAGSLPRQLHSMRLTARHARATSAYAVYSRSYDGAGRLKTFTIGNTTRTLTYDGAWRIIGANDAAPAINRSYLYDNLDRLTGKPTISRSYAYDLSGNRTSLGIGAASYAYTYATTARSRTACSLTASSPAGFMGSTFRTESKGLCSNSFRQYSLQPNVRAAEIGH